MRKFEALRFAHWLVLAISLGVTLLTWESVRKDSAKRLQNEFDVHVSQIANRVERRVQDGRMILQATAGLFSASDKVTREEFHAFISALEVPRNYPGIKNVGIAWKVPVRDKAKFQQENRMQNAPGYAIWPAGEQSLLAPVVYLEPSSDTARNMLGFDMLSEPERRSAMERARDSGRSAIAGPVRMVLPEPDNAKTEFLVMTPIYREGMSHGTVEERRASIIGWAYLSFRIDEVIPGVLGDEAGKELNRLVALHVFFGDGTSVDAQVYQTEATRSHTPDVHDAMFSATRVIEMPDKSFVLKLHSTPEFNAGVNDAKSNAILFAGLFASALLTLMIWQLVTGRERAVALASDMSREMLGREKRFRQMFEDNASIVYIIDPADGRIIDANHAAEAFWGYSIDELQHMNIADINQSPLAEIQLGLQQQVEAGHSGQFYYRHRLKNGDIRDVEIFRTTLTHDNRTYIYCTAHDITSRREAERALSESQAKLQAIIETAMDAVVQLDGDGIIIDWNSRAERTFGWSREEAIGKPLLDCIIPQPYRTAYLDGVQHFVDDDDGAIRHSHFEIEAMHRSGQQFPIEVAVTTMIGSDGSSEYCAFMHDISERRKSDKALRKARVELENRVFERTAELVRANRRLNSEIAERTQAQEALQQSQEMLRQLVAHQDRIRENERKRIAREIHDELGQHLLVLRIDVSMLTRPDNEHPKLGERVEAILQHIDTTMKSVRAIINNLRPSVLDLGLHAALEWQAEEFQRRSGIACDLIADDDNLNLDDSVSTVLFRIVQEALTNVMRHAKANHVQIELRRESKRLVMTVADNGIGMQQSAKNEQRSFGLVGIRERLHMLGGDLQVDSNRSGTTLKVSVPL